MAPREWRCAACGAHNVGGVRCRAVGDDGRRCNESVFPRAFDASREGGFRLKLEGHALLYEDAATGQWIGKATKERYARDLKKSKSTEGTVILIEGRSVMWVDDVSEGVHVKRVNPELLPAEEVERHEEAQRLADAYALALVRDAVAGGADSDDASFASDEWDVMDGASSAGEDDEAGRDGDEALFDDLDDVADVSNDPSDAAHEEDEETGERWTAADIENVSPNMQEDVDLAAATWQDGRDEEPERWTAADIERLLAEESGGDDSDALGRSDDENVSPNMRRDDDGLEALLPDRVADPEVAEAEEEEEEEEENLEAMVRRLPWGGGEAADEEEEEEADAADLARLWVEEQDEEVAADRRARRRRPDPVNRSDALSAANVWWLRDDLPAQQYAKPLPHAYNALPAAAREGRWELQPLKNKTGPYMGVTARETSYEMTAKLNKDKNGTKSIGRAMDPHFAGLIVKAVKADPRLHDKKTLYHWAATMVGADKDAAFAQWENDLEYDGVPPIGAAAPSRLPPAAPVAPPSSPRSAAPLRFAFPAAAPSRLSPAAPVAPPSSPRSAAAAPLRFAFPAAAPSRLSPASPPSSPRPAAAASPRFAFPAAAAPVQSPAPPPVQSPVRTSLLAAPAAAPRRRRRRESKDSLGDEDDDENVFASPLVGGHL
jgi:hypothetical protein